MTRFLAIILSVSILLLPARAVAQPPATAGAPPSTDQFQLPEPGDILPLHRGQSAPQDGLLIGAEDLLQIQQSYERMRFLLGLTQTRDAEVCDVRVQMEHAHTAAAEERLTLRDGLWTARQQELLAAIAAAQAQAQQAGQRSWFESPPLWAAIGAVLATVVFLAVSVR